MLKNLKHHTKYGLFTGLAIAIYIGIVKSTELRNIRASEFGVFLILIIGVAVSALQFMKQQQYNIRFDSAMGNAFRTVAMAALLTVALNFLSFALYPQLKEQKLEALAQQGKKLGKPQAEIDAYVAEQRKNFYALELSSTIFPIMVVGSIVGVFFAVFTVQMAASTKRK